MGCGETNPLGLAAILYINGVENVTAADIKNIREEYAAFSLYELLIGIYLEPQKYFLDLTERNNFNKRLSRFKINALREGNLTGGIENTGIDFKQVDIVNNSLESGIFDIIASKSVLEHVFDFEKCVKEFDRILSGKGIMYHHVDLVDHRVYTKPNKYNNWSFLTSDNHRDKISNMLRYSELKYIFESFNFDFLNLQIQRREIPQEIFDKLSGKYKSLIKEELSITGISTIIKRKADIQN